MTIKGRGAESNPLNRFEKIEVEFDPEAEPSSNRTEVFADFSKSIITKNDSPDVGFTYSVNPYRGCEHGCAYCYARPTHEYLGLSSGLDFESKLFAKKNAAELLRRELSAPSWKPETVTLSGVTDPYQPVERKLRITRQCLEVLAEFRNPVAIITKNHLVTRDLDLFLELNRYRCILVLISITSLEPSLSRILEPRASQPRQRVEALQLLRDNGIPAGVMVAPMVPAINDHEIPAILKAAADAKAVFAGTTVVRLPYAVKEIFSEWLERHFPDRKEKVLHRLESMRGGKLNDSKFHSRMRGEGPFAEQIQRLFKMYVNKLGLDRDDTELSAEHFIRPGQLRLF